MFQPLAKLFPSDKKNQAHAWLESDRRYFIQDWLRGQLKTEQIYCESVRANTAAIRVATPTLYQAVVLLEYDLNLALIAEGQEKITKLRVQLR